MSDETWFARLISHSISGREDTFRSGVRSRDRKCVISGEDNNEYLWDDWTGLHAAHVFPLEYESLWIQYDYGRLITNMGSVMGSSKINSIQNGLLMHENWHSRFDQYLFSINPDVSILELGLFLVILTRYRMAIRLLRSGLITGK